MQSDGGIWKKKRERLARERMDRERASRRMVRAGAMAAIMLVAVLAAYLVLSNKGSEAGYTPALPAGTGASPTEVAIPVSELGDSARFYTYDSGGTKVRFFAGLGSDGNARVGTDACDVCYKSHKGYHQSGSSMQCNNCGKVFPISDIGVKNAAGGCWPSSIPMKVEGGRVRIARADLDAKVYLFD